MKKLYDAALTARKNSYAPFSCFAVGAAVISAKGNIYKGCNIENASFGLTCCAERIAIYNAVSNGETELDAICVAADTSAPVAPCGACRQVMAEFGIKRILLGNLKGELKEYSLDELLPYRFYLHECAGKRSGDEG